MPFKFNPLTGTFDLVGSSGSGSGDVTGPASSTDNAVARFDGTTGKLIQNSVVTIADTTGNMAGVGTINSLVLPSSDFVGRTDTQTLTNKTLTTPIISTISNTGTLTLPTSTDTLVGRATTDTLTNKSIDGDTNTLTNIPAANLKIASQATGDILYASSSSVWSRLGAGADGTVLTLASGVPSWATAPSPTPRGHVILVDYDRPDATGDHGTTSYSTNGTSASAAFSSTPGMQLIASTGTTGYARAYKLNQRTGLNLNSYLFDRYIVFYGMMAVFFNGTSGGKMEIGVGGSQGQMTGTSYKTLAFRIEKTSGNPVIYAVTGTGSAETATDITTSVTALTGWTVTTTNNWMPFMIVFNPGVNAKFYMGGSLMTTITTNLPSGGATVTSNDGLLGAQYANNANSTGSQGQFNILQCMFEYNAY